MKAQLVAFAFAFTVPLNFHICFPNIREAEEIPPSRV